MDHSLQPKRGILYPLLVAAAVTVILLSALGIAALIGILPLAHSEPTRPYAPLVPPALGVPGAAQNPGAGMPTAGSAPRAELPHEHSAPMRLLASPCGQCGTVESVVSYATARGQAGAAGIAAGGLAATSARAFPADRSDNSYLRKPTRYRVVVRMDDRSTLRTFYLNAPDWRTGERVQVTDRGRLELLRV